MPAAWQWKVSEFADSLKDRAAAVGETVTGKAAELAGVATDQAQHWSDGVRSSVRRVAGDATRAAGDATALLEAGDATALLEETRQSSMEVAERAASRNKAVSSH